MFLCLGKILTALYQRSRLWWTLGGKPSFHIYFHIGLSEEDKPSELTLETITKQRNSHCCVEY